MDFEDIADCAYTISDDGVKFRETLFARTTEEGLTLTDENQGWVNITERTVSVSPYHDYGFEFVPRSGELPVEDGHHVLKIEKGDEALRVVKIPKETDDEIDGPKVSDEIASAFEDE